VLAGRVTSTAATQQSNETSDQHWRGNKADDSAKTQPPHTHSLPNQTESQVKRGTPTST
jgi:hypothetical protein